MRSRSDRDRRTCGVRRLMLFLALLLILPAALGERALASQLSEEERLGNYRRAALLDLEWILLETFARPDVLDFWRAIPEETVLIIEAERPPAGTPPAREAPGASTRFWAWRTEQDMIVGVDENGDEGAAAARPDSSADLLLIDYDGDGGIDRLVDWEDEDGDGQAERQVLYALTPGPLGGGFISAILVEQYDAVRGFFHLDRWQYIQRTCQTRSDFSGDGFFFLARYDAESRRWSGYEENPFCFYDPDHDGLSEVALRLSGQGETLRAMRWSFDTDNDGTPESPYDYDLSISATGRVIVPEAVCTERWLRGGPLRLLRWDRARQTARAARWRRILLAVDEDDRNVAPTDPETGERWEGVIADGVPGFPAVGGPGCGWLNKRYELDLDASGRMMLYVSPVDGRVHLFGAERGWLQIDADQDGREDARLEMEDRDGDGFFDLWRWDGNSEGVWDALDPANGAWGKGVADSTFVPGYENLARAEVARAATTGPSQARRYQREAARWIARGQFLPATAGEPPVPPATRRGRRSR